MLQIAIGAMMHIVAACRSSASNRSPWTTGSLDHPPSVRVSSGATSAWAIGSFTSRRSTSRSAAASASIAVREQYVVV